MECSLNVSWMYADVHPPLSGVFMDKCKCVWNSFCFLQTSRRTGWKEELVDSPQRNRWEDSGEDSMGLSETVDLKLDLTSALFSFPLVSYLRSSSGHLDEDEVTWGSDELPIEDINSKFTEGWSGRWQEAFSGLIFFVSWEISELAVSQKGWRYFRWIGGIPDRLVVSQTGWRYLR